MLLILVQLPEERSNLELISITAGLRCMDGYLLHSAFYLRVTLVYC